MREGRNERARGGKRQLTPEEGGKGDREGEAREPRTARSGHRESCQRIRERRKELRVARGGGIKGKQMSQSIYLISGSNCR